MASSAISFTSDASLPMERVIVKNTFVHLSEPEDESPSRRRTKRFTVPSSAQLAGLTLHRSPSLESHSSRASTSRSCEGSTVSSPREALATPSGDAASATPANGVAGGATPPAATSPPPRAKLNAEAAEWIPAVAPGAPLADPEAQEIAAQVATVMGQLQTTLDCCGKAVQVEVFCDGLGQCCAMLWIQPEDAWMAESLLTAAKEALLRISANCSGVYVLGYQGRPFAPQPHGFSATLAKMQDKSKACWELYKKGCCSRGATCRWRHPERAIPLSVVVGSAVHVFAAAQ